MAKNIRSVAADLSDYLEFVNFFASYGISHAAQILTKKQAEDIYKNEVANKSRRMVMVEQTIFHFDENDEFIGTESDELKGFRKRKV